LKIQNLKLSLGTHNKNQTRQIIYNLASVFGYDSFLLLSLFQVT